MKNLVSKSFRFFKLPTPFSSSFQNTYMINARFFHLNHINPERIMSSIIFPINQDNIIKINKEEDNEETQKIEFKGRNSKQPKRVFINN
jgi:hypothetical protein